MTRKPRSHVRILIYRTWAIIALDQAPHTGGERKKIAEPTLFCLRSQITAEPGPRLRLLKHRAVFLDMKFFQERDWGAHMKFRIKPPKETNLGVV